MEVDLIEKELHYVIAASGKSCDSVEEVFSPFPSAIFFKVVAMLVD